MRIVYFISLLLIVSNLIIYSIGGLMGVNLYKKYGKQILNGFWKFLLLVLALYVTFLLCGLVV